MSIFKRHSKKLSEIFNENFTPCTKCGISHSVLREPSVVDEFYFETHKAADDNIESVSVVDPIIMLFNQQRLESMGSTAAKAFLDSLAPKSDSLGELRKNCSDEQLVSMIKSKYLQSPAEILSWCRYMEQNITEFNSEVQKLVEAQKQKSVETTNLNVESDNLT